MRFPHFASIAWAAQTALWESIHFSSIPPAYLIGMPYIFGWAQSPMFAALLGLTDNAQADLSTNCQLFNTDYRFPAMWGPFDYIPDGDHGANILNTAQLM